MSRPYFQKEKELLLFFYEIPILSSDGKFVDYRRKVGGVSASRSRAGEAVEISAKGVQDLCNPTPMTSDSVLDIASIGKQFTAATLLKLCDEEAFAEEQKGEARKNFPQGIDTPISHFMLRLRTRFSQPECLAALDLIEDNEDYKKITLRDLLNHTHGLGVSERINQLMSNGDSAPMELHEILGVVIKNGAKKHGEFDYGGPGPDIAAMIIEAVTGKSFDDAVRDVVLTPNQLHSTYPQAHAMREFEVNSRMTRGHKIAGFVAKKSDDLDEFLKVIHMNSRPNTRAASGFKTTMGDLVKFADLFMGAKMFQSEEIKNLVRNREREVCVDADYGKFSYHLAIKKEEGSDFVGHPGGSHICSSELSYNPQTGETKAHAEVLENVTHSLSAFIFQKVFPDHQDFLSNKDGDFRKLRNSFFWRINERMSEEERVRILAEEMQKNSQGAYLVGQYAAIARDVQEHPERLREPRKEMVFELIEKAKARLVPASQIGAASASAAVLAAAPTKPIK